MRQFAETFKHSGIPTLNIDETISFFTTLGASVLFDTLDEVNNERMRVVLIDFRGLLLEYYQVEVTGEINSQRLHISFYVDDINMLYNTAKSHNFDLQGKCKDSIQISTIWPGPLKWFSVYGFNNELIEFCQHV